MFRKVALFHGGILGACPFEQVSQKKKMEVGISNMLVGRTELPERMVPQERSVYRRRYKKDD
jgi:hypothetical protein